MHKDKQQHLSDIWGNHVFTISSTTECASDFILQVHLVMDFHAHLSSCEIIGLLGGQWDSEKKMISIRQAFPCRRALGSHSGTSVELDPEAEVETRALMDAQGLTPVGW